jgi:SAM-dependent methyltransferase
VKIFGLLEENATFYEWAQRLLSLNYRVVLRELRAEGFFDPSKSCLDVGCGTGFLRDFTPETDYLGVDLNPTYIALARRKRGACFQVGNALELEGLGRTFDQVVSVGLLHHLDDAQVRSALAQFRGRLNPGGHIFIFDALWPTGFNPVGRSLRQSDNGAFVRNLPQWRALFESQLALRAIRAVSQWPFDYVFARATGPQP